MCGAGVGEDIGDDLVEVLQSFPDDNDIFEKLKQYIRSGNVLTVEGQRVDANDLHADAYAIRWYVMKCQADAWHIDGRLVKKQGVFDVTKTFAGNREGVALAKEDFYIVASNASGTKRHTLTLGNSTSYDAETDTYTWRITGVDYGESWVVTENSWSIKDVYFLKFCL